MQPSPHASRRIVPDTRRRDTLIAVAAGVAMLGFILYAIAYFSRQVDSTGMAEGVIVSKAFAPRPETQITVGQGGLDSRHLAGEYSFLVRVPRENNRQYKVLVDPGLYATRNVGDPLFFQRGAP